MSWRYKGTDNTLSGHRRIRSQPGQGPGRILEVPFSAAPMAAFRKGGLAKSMRLDRTFDFWYQLTRLSLLYIISLQFSYVKHGHTVRTKYNVYFIRMMQ